MVKKHPFIALSIFYAVMIIFSSMLASAPNIIVFEVWQYIVILAMLYVCRIVLDVKTFLAILIFILFGSFYRWLENMLLDSTSIMNNGYGIFLLYLLSFVLFFIGLIVLYFYLSKRKIIFKKNLTRFAPIAILTIIRAIFMQVYVNQLHYSFANPSPRFYLYLTSSLGSQLFENIFICVLLCLFFLLVQKSSVQRTTHEETPCS